MQYFHHSNDNEIAKLDDSLFKKSERESEPQLGLKCFDCVSLWSRTRNNSCITPTEKTRTKMCAKNSCYSLTFSIQTSITEPEIYYARRSCSEFPEKFPKPGDLVSSKASELKILQEFSLRNTVVIQQRFRKQHWRKISLEWNFFRSVEHLGNSYASYLAHFGQFLFCFSCKGEVIFTQCKIFHI